MLPLATLALLGIRPPTPLASRPAAARYGAVAPTGVRVRRASGGELLPSRIFQPLSLLCAQNLFGPPADEDAERQLRDAMHQNLVERFSVLNSRPNALLVAEVGSRIIGSCGIEISMLNENGRADPTGDVRQRALLSNLVVARGFQGQGVGTRLLRRSEALVRRWGMNELLLKVEDGNLDAERLYLRLGYDQVYVDALAEKPAPGTTSVRWVRTTNICLRKELGEEDEEEDEDEEEEAEEAGGGFWGRRRVFSA